MINLFPKGDDINGILHRYPSLNATCQSLSYQQDGSQCINAIIISKNFHFCSRLNNNEWFSFHIPNVKMYVTHYSMQMPERSNHAHWHYPVSWKYYGIDESGVMHSIHNVTNANFDNENRIKTFELTQKGYFSQFKLIMEGENDGGTLDLRIYKIDLFGTIYSFFPLENRTCKTKQFSSISIFVLIILL